MKKVCQWEGHLCQCLFSHTSQKAQLRAPLSPLQTAWTGGSSSVGPTLVEIATARSFILNVTGALWLTQCLPHPWSQDGEHCIPVHQGWWILLFPAQCLYLNQVEFLTIHPSYTDLLPSPIILIHHLFSIPFQFGTIFPMLLSLLLILLLPLGHMLHFSSCNYTLYILLLYPLIARTPYISRVHTWIICIAIMYHLYFCINCYRKKTSTYIVPPGPRLLDQVQRMASQCKLTLAIPLTLY